MTLKNILAAVGQFPQDEAVLARALAISATHGAALTIVHIIDFPGQDPDIDGHDTLHGRA